MAAALPTDALKEAGQQLLGLLVQRATEAAAQRVTGLADRLTDVTESGGDFRAALGGKAQRNGQVDDDDDATTTATKTATTTSRAASRAPWSA